MMPRSSGPNHSSPLLPAGVDSGGGAERGEGEGRQYEAGGGVGHGDGAEVLGGQDGGVLEGVGGFGVAAGELVDVLELGEVGLVGEAEFEGEVVGGAAIDEEDAEAVGFGVEGGGGVEEGLVAELLGGVGGG